LLYAFGVSDGSTPRAGIILSGETLYGTTQFGGGGDGAYGLVYSLTLPTITPPSLVILGLDMNNYTFQSGVTYWITNSIYISGTTVLESNAIIKYSSGVSLFVDHLDCKGTSNNPTIFTSMNDDSVGVTIPGSSGSPVAGDYETALEIVKDTSTTVQNVSISYCWTGINFQDTDQNVEWTTNFLQNIWLQHLNCGVYSASDDAGSDQPFLSAANVFVNDCAGVFGGYFWAGTADSVSVSGGDFVGDDGYGGNLFYVTNSKFDDDLAAGTDAIMLDGDNNGFHDCLFTFGSDWYYY
jgi:hypothetical protein